MQQAFFTPDPTLFITRYEQYAHGTGPDLFTAIEERTKAMEASSHDRWYCIRQILYEQYLWDMRCWDKPKHLYTNEEVKSHISAWIADHDTGNWTYNCGHCLYCIRKLLGEGWASMDDIAGFVIRNNNLTYVNEIGTWNYGGLGLDKKEGI